MGEVPEVNGREEQGQRAQQVETHDDGKETDGNGEARTYLAVGFAEKGGNDAEDAEGGCEAQGEGECTEEEGGWFLEWLG